MSETHNGIRYEIMAVSSKQCEEHNTRAKDLIDNGLDMPWRPNAAILKAEAQEKERLRLEAADNKTFESYAKKFWQAVALLLPPEAQKIAQYKRSSIQFKGFYLMWSSVKVYNKYSPYSGGGAEKKVLRVECGNIGDKHIYKSSTQDIAQLPSETETILKVAKVLNEKYSKQVAETTAELARKESAKRVASFYEANKTALAPLNTSFYRLTEGSNGVIYGDIGFRGTPEQWLKLAEFVKNLTQ